MVNLCCQGVWRHVMINCQYFRVVRFRKMLPFQSSVMPFQAAAVAVQGTLQRAAPSSVTSPGPDCVIDQRHTDWLTIGLLSLLRLLRLLSLLSLLSLLGLLSLVAPDLCKLRGEFTLFSVTPSHVARPRLRHQTSFRRIGERECARSCWSWPSGCVLRVDTFCGQAHITFAPPPSCNV